MLSVQVALAPGNLVMVSTLAQRLRLLRTEPAAVAAQVLSEALRHADEDEVGEIAGAIAALPHPLAAAGLIQCLNRLEINLRRDLASAVPAAAAKAGVQRCMSASKPRLLQRALRFIELRRDAALLSLVPPYLLSDRPEIAAQAATTVLNLTVAVIGPEGRHAAPGLRESVDAALAQVFDTYSQHRQHDALLAIAIAAGRATGALQQRLIATGHPARFALQGLPEQFRHPLVQRNLLRWLMIEPLARPAARWLRASLRDAGAAAVVLDHAHLTRLPAVRLTLRSLGKGQAPLPEAIRIAALPISAAALVPGFLQAISIPSAARVEALSICAAHRDATVRLQSLRVLRSFSGAAVEAIEREHLTDAAPEVAAAAAWRWTLDPDRPRGELESSADAWRTIAARECGAAAEWARCGLASHDVRDFFRWWLKLRAAQRVVAATQLLTTHANAMRKELARRILAGPREERVTAVLLARRLHLVRELEPIVLRAVADADARIASAAVAALGRDRAAQMVELKPSKQRDDALRRSLTHEDARVRANAIESLADGSHAIEVVHPLVRDPANRPRANAIRALLPLEAGEVIIELRRMLRDDHPLHRISAIWVAARSRRESLVADLRELAQDEPLPEIRARAAAGARLLQHGARPFHPHMQRKEAISA